MKWKRNSKKSSQSQKSINLLLSKNNNKKSVKQIPINFSEHITKIDLSKNVISSLKGIQKYKSLQTINLNYNSISQYQQLKYLQQCPKLKQVWIQQNPICTNINYLYTILTSHPTINMINGIKFGNKFQVIQKWQKQNGSKIMVFLMQSCIILDSVKQNRWKINHNNVKQQLKLLQNKFRINKQKQKQKIIYQTNEKINNSLLLQNVQTVQLQDNDISQIKNYFLDRVIQIGSQLNSELIQNLLSKIQVTDQQEQNQFINKPQVVNYILKDQMSNQFHRMEKYNQPQISIKTNYDNSNLKHFMSVDTALETMQTAKRYSMCQNAIYFSLDVQFLKIVNIFLYQQTQRLTEALFYSKKNLTILINQNDDEYMNYYPAEQKQKINSPKIIYNNSIILSNILCVLQNSIKKIAFRKIIHQRNKQPIDPSTIEKMQQIFVKVVKSELKQAFELIILIKRQQDNIMNLMRIKRMEKIFKGWKNVKVRKQKLLKNILKRKIKGTTFITAITMLKWKMNSRSQRLKKMVNRAILNTNNQNVPNSRKGIELAYLRVMSNRKHII